VKNIFVKSAGKNEPFLEIKIQNFWFWDHKSDTSFDGLIPKTFLRTGRPPGYAHKISL